MRQRKWDPLSWLDGCQMASVCAHLHNLFKLTCCTANINIFASGRMLNQVNETLLRTGSLCTHSCDTRYLFLAEGRNNESVSSEPVFLFCNSNLSKALSFSFSLSLTHTFSWCSLSQCSSVCFQLRALWSPSPSHLQIPLRLYPGERICNGYYRWREEAQD